MSNPYIEFYSRQAGSGLPGFKGYYTQRGRGFFGRLFSWALPFIKEIFPVVSKELVTGAVDIGKDLLSGENLKMAAKKRTRETGSRLLQKASEKLQSGGRRRRKKRRTIRLKLAQTVPYRSRKKAIKRKKTKKRKTQQFL